MLAESLETLADDLRLWVLLRAMNEAVERINDRLKLKPIHRSDDPMNRLPGMSSPTTGIFPRDRRQIRPGLAGGPFVLLGRTPPDRPEYEPEQFGRRRRWS